MLKSAGGTFATNHVSQLSTLGNFDNYLMFIEKLVAYSK